MTDTLSIHAYRDGKIIHTILVELGEHEWWTAYPEGQSDVHLSQRKHVEEVERDVEYYMDGFVAGYDEGIAHASENTGKNFRGNRCCAGDPSCACEH